MADSAVWFPATVRAAGDETAALRSIELDLARDTRASHQRVGQYLKVRAPDGAGGAIEGYFALASPPGHQPELLVKRGTPLGDAMAALERGATVETSLAMGGGYPLADLAGRDLLLLAAGSGIAPLRAVVQQLLATRAAFGLVALYYGQRRPDEFAYRREHDAWRGGGIEYVPVVSRPEGSDWHGATGHLQDVLQARPPASSHTAALLCGMKGMVVGATEVLVAQGVPRQQIFLNY